MKLWRWFIKKINQYLECRQLELDLKIAAKRMEINERYAKAEKRLKMYRRLK